jgi:hypothetical protein
VRVRFLGDARPASTLVVVRALARPEWLVEVEAIAWRADEGGAGPLSPSARDAAGEGAGGLRVHRW